MKFRFKVWCEVDGKPLMGPGRFRLLSELQETGSINASAKNVGISYRRAWAQIREMERLVGHPLVECKRGGSAGGGTKLTSQALKLMKQYARMQEAVGEAITSACAGVKG